MRTQNVEGAGARGNAADPKTKCSAEPSKNTTAPHSRVSPRYTWFRLYSEFAWDPKVQLMSEVMQRRLIMLMCLRCSDVTVTVDVTERDAAVAFALRLDEKELAETKSLFVRKNFIDEHWNLLNWERRQCHSDSSAERTRQWRDRRKSPTGDAGDETRRHGDGLEESRGEKRREEEKEQESHSVAKSAEMESSLTARNHHHARPRANSRGTRLPPEWVPSQELKDWAKQTLPSIDLATAIAEFVDYWVAVPGAKGCKTDWDATFRNRVRQIASRKPIGPAPTASRYPPFVPSKRRAKEPTAGETAAIRALEAKFGRKLSLEAPSPTSKECQ